MIKVAELFYSLQGEGLWQGVPSIFLRTFGCNFTCQGFGMGIGELSTEKDKIDPKLYDSYDKLPLVHTGCDSYASWDPRFKKLSPMLSTEEIILKIKELLPNFKFEQKCHLVITGGEPMLGWQTQYIEVIEECLKIGLTDLTFETNGTQPIKPELKEYLSDLGGRGLLTTTWSISPKLRSSGHTAEEAIKPQVVKDYVDVPNSFSYLKYVLTKPTDIWQVVGATHAYKQAGVDIPVYLMPVGGTDVLYDANKKWVAELAMKWNFRYSQRLQVDLWKNQWGT